MKRAALVLTDLSILSRHTVLIDELTERGLTPIVVFGWLTPADQLARWTSAEGHPFSALEIVRHVPDGDVDTVLLAIRPLLADHRIEAVLSCGEVFVDTAGALADFFGVRGPGAIAARTCRNKLLQRMAVPQLSPTWLPLTPGTRAEAETWRTFPAVVKPTGRMSSSGVRRLESADELRAALAHYPDTEPLLIEELVVGPEYSVEALVHDGTVVWAGVTAKQTNESATNFFTETGHTSPADGLTDEQTQRLTDAAEELLRAIRFQDGIAHAEFRLTATGVRLMEVAARPPGDAIMMLWHLATGAPLEPSIVDIALGIDPKHPTATRRASQRYVEHPHGQLADVRADGVEVSWVTRDALWPVGAPARPDAPGRACGVLVTREVGDTLGELADSGERSASVVVDAPLTADVAEVAYEYSQRVEIMVL